MNNIKNQINILKHHIKKSGFERKTQKLVLRKNQSNYSKIVGILSPYSKQYKEIYAKYKEVEMVTDFPSVPARYITALHILYNRLRNKPSHLQSEDKENEYNKIIDKLLEWLEKEEEVCQSSERRMAEEK